MPKILVKITRQQNCNFFNCNIDDTVEVDFQEYIGAVVASEIGNAPIQACKAQAVAARGLAISRGVLNKNPISDSSSSAQAYRAQRYDKNNFKNAIEGTELTSGLVLFYNGKIAVTHYSANNGGRTTSSQQRWGGKYPYLIQQDDPWDKATNSVKYGHGVGMSQLGAIYAAKNGIKFQDILKFYYPGCKLVENYGENYNFTVILNDKAKSVIQLAKSKLGDPYVYAAYGDKCTPSIREKYATRNMDYYKSTYKSCPVLSNKQTSCTGCKWQGHLCYDCRGFAGYVMHEGAKIKIEGGGATSQYNTKSNWELFGKVEEMPNVVCNVFKYKNGKMSHTGIHIGNGEIIHCSTIVKVGSLTDTTWTHYAVPKGLYTKEQLEKAEKVIMMLTVKKGSSGENVKELQRMLNKIFNENLKIDGIFGQITQNIVKDFQSIIGLNADGIVGPLTWAALRTKLNDVSPEQEQPIEKEEPVINDQKEKQQDIILPKELGKQLFDFLKQYYS